jgi:hypothetical protein
VTYLSAAASNSAAIEADALKAGMKKGGAAKGELVLAIFELANCFRHGWGVQKDAVAARQYYETAANLGDTDAMNEAAWCYLEGFGGKKDKVSRCLRPLTCPISISISIPRSKRPEMSDHHRSVSVKNDGEVRIWVFKMRRTSPVLFHWPSSHEGSGFSQRKAVFRDLFVTSCSAWAAMHLELIVTSLAYYLLPCSYQQGKEGTSSTTNRMG